MPVNHGDFRGRSSAVFAVTIIFTVLCTIFVWLRVVSRAAIVKKKILLDDYFIIAAWAIAVGIAGSICFGCAWGLGRHETDIPLAWQENLRKADYVFTVLYQPALMTLKTSILAFYLALPTSNRYFKWACIATLVVVNAGGLALELVTILQCRPVEAAFSVPKPSNSHCMDVITIYLSSTPLNLITDLALLFLPMPMLTSMRLPSKQKIILVVTFSFGFFVTAVDVVRVVYLQSASTARLMAIFSGTDSKKPTTAYSTDFSWYASLSYLWSAIEVDVGIMVACVPGLKPLVSRFLPYMLRDRGDPSSKNGSFSTPNDEPDLRAPPQTPLANEKAEHNQSDIGQEDDDTTEMGFLDFLASDNQRRQVNETPVDMPDFLTTPEMKELPQVARTETAKANTSRDTRRPSVHFFDFVDMDSHKDLTRLTVRESVFPIAMVSILFFIWGFEYGLLDVLNQQFQRVAHMTSTQGTGIHSAYYVGYFFGPLLVGRPVLRHWGFKACYTVGLSIYGCGTLIFWPAAVLTSFPAFVITNFIVAFGLSILEVSANPFIALCGPPQYAEMRLNLSQGVQAIGSVIAPLIAYKAFFSQRLHAPSLVGTQWAYLGISLFTILLAVGYYYVPLPEATDEELEHAAERAGGARHTKIGSIRVIWITLALGVFGQFCYVGGQEVNGTMFDTYLGFIAPSYNPGNYMAIAHTAFAVSRFLAAGLGFWIKPRVLTLGYFIGAIVFGVLAMNYEGSTGTAMIVMVFFCEGPLFPLIFAQALRGIGRHTKLASVFITMAVSGGSVFAPISNHISQTDNRIMYALVVGVAVFAAGTVFPLWLNVSPLARKQCDPMKGSDQNDDGRPASASSRASRALAFLHARKKGSEGSADAEWTERASDGSSGRVR